MQEISHCCMFITLFKPLMYQLFPFAFVQIKLSFKSQ